LPTFAERYQGPADLPQQVPVFPLRGAILLPRAALRLNVFEARYLALVDDALATSRVLVIVQPAAAGEDESPPGKSEPLKRVGCVGRLSAYQELEDGRLLITLTGIARCRLTEEIDSRKPYRLYSVSCEPFTGDFAAGAGEHEVDRERLLTTLKKYLEARQLKADWTAILKSPSEALVNALCIMSPYGSEEKQALLEAPDLKTRAEVLVALAEMELAASSDGSGTALQ
jgi:uncharacterized protein